MAGLYGDFVARTVSQGEKAIVATSWRPITSGGTNPLKGRRHLRFQLKSNSGGTMALEYVQKNADGTFTTPTSDVRLCTIVPGNSIEVEPIGDNVQVYGRLVKKAGYTGNSIRVIVTEYA